MLNGGGGNDVLTGGAGNDTFMLELSDSKRGQDRVIDFNSVSDLIRVDTANGNEATIDALKASANIRWTQDSDAGNLSGSSSNDAKANDTIIYYTHGTATATDDEIVMVLEDFSDELIIDMFDVI